MKKSAHSHSALIQNRQFCARIARKKYGNFKSKENIFSQSRPENVLFHPYRGYKIRVSRLYCEKYSLQLVRNVDSDECLCYTRLRLVLQTAHSPKLSFPHQLRNILFSTNFSIKNTEFFVLKNSFFIIQLRNILFLTNSSIKKNEFFVLKNSFFIIQLRNILFLTNFSIKNTEFFVLKNAFLIIQLRNILFLTNFSIKNTEFFVLKNSFFIIQLRNILFLTNFSIKNTEFFVFKNSFFIIHLKNYNANFFTHVVHSKLYKNFFKICCSVTFIFTFSFPINSREVNCSQEYLAFPHTAVRNLRFAVSPKVSQWSYDHTTFPSL